MTLDVDGFYDRRGLVEDCRPFVFDLGDCAAREDRREEEERDEDLCGAQHDASEV
ncbi:MAG: hypothetical protein UV82_C0003G0009 [Candidatus Magasanikbacteria bacterium GW2011_GWD2_43_18]|uniref:Uncharacterized protein n=1 Tax=Candidatus Magasanikbacteria bacterium GW2011_GWE2_42_7 TaxID=1619052 RepID=A0A0G1EC64_9BACT|nr:MAG: hypothetical protein UV18_C0012G0007 [Candidatus Magasanikbacteria bacterium GW2011_GWC2_42_27]KKS72183.1 MAG: hypothetical protein UV42_C0012G0010 [Candidatus Magasanikbacteria bacterium GW2011_GWE2_42_7]KKT04910.1 MAG: hypothetical protein UV82_C0003G0009 [Candidatus Magasanikbacteria bacterium GW2011_GWD2_43_18]KKT25402.1 MAG: hypothetical protein UW10_C0008G0014 [Candidatus Magasanikbacteria bacterium GW2011_GWA2_43_9]